MVYIEAKFPLQKIGIDLLGPFPETPNNKKYIIVMVDYLTKWAETDLLPNGNAEEIAQFFVKHIVLRHGYALAGMTIWHDDHHRSWKMLYCRFY